MRNVKPRPETTAWESGLFLTKYIANPSSNIDENHDLNYAVTMQKLLHISFIDFG